MSEEQVVVVNRQGGGMVAGILAIVLAILGILFLGFIFVPLAAVVALFGTIIAVSNKNMGAIGVNALAWVLAIIGLFTSPVLLAMIGFGAYGLSQ